MSQSAADIVPKLRSNLDWLMENAGPVIRYRTATELIGNPNAENNESLRKALIRSEITKYWLDRLRPSLEWRDIHSGRSEAFENVMGKLYEFGLRKDVRLLNQKTAVYRRWFAKRTHVQSVFGVFYRTIVAAFLIMTGCVDDAVTEWVLERLDTVYPFAKKADLEDVYVEANSVPWPYRSYPSINPDLYQLGEMKVPWIHDLNSFLHAPSIMEDTQLRKKVGVIVDFILKPDYQRLHSSYGLIRVGRKHYVMGWSIHLPSFFESNYSRSAFAALLLRLDLLSRIQTARHSTWFVRAVRMLEKYRDADGLLSFPCEFLPEKKFGYWVSGSRMALEGGQRKEKGIKCESTFRFLKIITK
jgi:hypothetical protein